MTNEEFKYWIGGYFALSSDETINKKQLTIIKNHILLVKAVEGVLDLGIESLLSFIDENLEAGALVSRAMLERFFVKKRM